MVTPNRANHRRRAAIAGVVAGLVAGGAVGAALLTGAAPPADPALPRPTILHAAPALVTAGAPVELTAATFCAESGLPSCAISAASAAVRPAGVSGWTEVSGRPDGGAFRFAVPASLVPPDGFSYRLVLRTADGVAIAYPPGGDEAAIRVVTTAGLPVRDLGVIRWDRRRPADEVVLRLPYGSGDGEVGRWGGEGELEAIGPSSFDVGPDGSIAVADWVNRRIQVFGAAGRLREVIASPTTRPVDLALTGDGGYVLSTLGTEATAFEVAAAGGVLGRYPVGFGVATRVAASATGGPRVQVGAAQWAAVRSAPGIPLAGDEQGRTQTTSVPLADGDIGVSADIDGRSFAAVWTRPDGSRGGAVVRLPAGVAPGADYFVHPLADGGAVVAKGVWDDTHFGVIVVRLDARGRIRSTGLLPEPSIEQAARYSTVRYSPAGDVLVVFTEPGGIHIDRFIVR